MAMRQEYIFLQSSPYNNKVKKQVKLPKTLEPPDYN